MSEERRRAEFMRALQRLESFQNAKPTRRFLVATDNAIGELKAFLSRVLDARHSAQTDAELVTLTTWSIEAKGVIEALERHRLRISHALRNELH